MSQKKFIYTLKKLLGISPASEEQKQTNEEIRHLMGKLEQHYLSLKEALKHEGDASKREALKESLSIIKEQLKKGKDFLHHD
ncbi:hypothetical protein [Sulfurospirillum deleyianum]|uniref:Uncharacterized protein n=1 Tax=Sulfurospirillum deleyianum (strain ATCC 51133 / DSM 6946 / 5175) TaxID=525898 RepID=D1B487_SULD5|nr:hypothetical protein [Sulfurospirillum deleyianum]ACZ12907.1 conserved hypothetical protein [Sulfurospirillum deleyianum DSM 6946]